MSNNLTMSIEEKEIGKCIIPSSKLDNNKIGIYIHKLMNTLPSDKVYEKPVMIDYSIVKNKKINLKKEVKECNYIITKPYLENNISPALFSTGENCFIRFLYNDIKQPYYLSEGTNFDGRDTDYKKITASDGKTGSYELNLDTEKGLIELKADTNNFGSYANSISIIQNSDTICLDSLNANITLSPSNIEIRHSSTNFSISNNGVSILGSECNILAELKINGKTLDEIIEGKVEDRLKNDPPEEFKEYIKAIVQDVIESGENNNE